MNAVKPGNNALTLGVAALLVSASVAHAGGRSFEYVSGSQTEYNPDPVSVSGNGRYVLVADSPTTGFFPRIWEKGVGLGPLLFEVPFPPDPAFGEPLQPQTVRRMDTNAELVVGGGLIKVLDGPDPAWATAYSLLRKTPDAVYQTPYDPALPMAQQQNAVALDVAWVGSDIFVIGELNGEGTVWKSGTPMRLEAVGNPAWSGNVVRIASNGRYAVGESSDVTGAVATRWDLQSGAPLAVSGPGIGNRASDVSMDGKVVVGTHYVPGVYGNVEAFRWEEGVGFQSLGGVEPGSGSQNPVVSGDGSMVFCEAFYSGNPIAAVWTAEGGMRRLDDFLINEIGIPVPNRDIIFGGGPILFYRVNDVSDDGRTIVGAASEGGFVADIGCQDTDDDGLCDDWETDGIDVDGDGVPELRLQDMGADPNVPDLFLEIDAVDGYAPDPQLAVELQNAFMASGVQMHVFIDETTITPVIDFGDGTTEPWDDFDTFKAAHFGTPLEALDPKWPLIRQAREWSFRYAAFAKKINNPTGGGPLGRAEIFGNDLMFGFETPTATMVKYPPEKMAAIVMHEFGHNLGLRHGGADNINFKPNYLSIMNYSFTLDKPAFDGTYVMDYSIAELDTLNEAALDEAVGVLGALDPLLQSRVTIWRADAPDGPGNEATGQIDGLPLDWNDNGDDMDNPTGVDLNTFRPANVPSVYPEILRGHDDWANVQLPIRGGPQYADFTAHTMTTADLPDEDDMEAALDALSGFANICTPDLDGSGAVDGSDLAALLAAWGTASPAADLNGDASVDGSDLAAMLAAWGACP